MTGASEPYFYNLYPYALVAWFNLKHSMVWRKGLNFMNNIEGYSYTTISPKSMVWGQGLEFMDIYTYYSYTTTSRRTIIGKGGNKEWETGQYERWLNSLLPVVYIPSLYSLY